MVHCLNGIDMDALEHTVDTLDNHPDLSRFQFRATNTWVDGTHNQAHVEEFYGVGQEDTSRPAPLVYEEDEPPILLGENKGANPVEYVLVGLSGCLTTALVAHAAARGIRLKSVKSYVEGDLDVRGFLGLSDDVRNGYEQIRVHFKIDSDEPPERIAELVEIAQRRSPVYDIITNRVPVQVDFETP